MEYQKIINLLGGEVTQPSKFRKKTLVEINDDAGGVHNNSQLKSKITMFAVKFAVSDAYILMEGNITVVG